MLVLLVLLFWCAISVPATLLLGRLVAVYGRARDLPYPAQVATSGHPLIGR